MVDVVACGGPAFHPDDGADEWDDPETEDGFDFAEEVEDFGFEADGGDGVWGEVEVTGEAIFVEAAAFVGVVHDFGREKSVNDSEEEDDGRDEVEGFDGDAVAELVQERLTGVVVGVDGAGEGRCGGRFGCGNRGASQKGESEEKSDL